MRKLMAFSNLSGICIVIGSIIKLYYAKKNNDYEADSFFS